MSDEVVAVHSFLQYIHTYLVFSYLMKWRTLTPSFTWGRWGGPYKGEFAMKRRGQYASLHFTVSVMIVENKGCSQDSHYDPSVMEVIEDPLEVESRVDDINAQCSSCKIIHGHLKSRPLYTCLWRFISRSVVQVWVDFRFFSLSLWCVNWIGIQMISVLRRMISVCVRVCVCVCVCLQTS